MPYATSSDVVRRKGPGPGYLEMFPQVGACTFRNTYCDGNYKESAITHSCEDEGDDLPEKRTGKGLFA